MLWCRGGAGLRRCTASGGGELSTADMDTQERVCVCVRARARQSMLLLSFGRIRTGFTREEVQRVCALLMAQCNPRRS